MFLTNFALQAATLAAPMPRIRRTKGGNRAAKHIAYINISVVLGGMQGGNRTAKHIASINISVVLGGMQGGNRTAKPCKGAIS